MIYCKLAQGVERHELFLKIILFNVSSFLQKLGVFCIEAGGHDSSGVALINVPD